MLPLCLVLAACAGDDDPADDGADEDPASTGADEDPGSESSGSPDDGTYVGLVRATLFTDNMTEAKGVHDEIAAAGESTATALGDFGHDVLLGTPMLGTTENEFLAVDQWHGLDGAAQFYGDPTVAEAFGMLFAQPPGLELFERTEGWVEWGDLEAGDSADPYFFAIVRGHLAGDTLEEAHATHDAVAGAAQQTANEAGDVAHLAFVGVDDPFEFLAIDVWTSDAAIEQVYTDPAFVQAFGQVFSAPPTLAIYRSTDWHQW